MGSWKKMVLETNKKSSVHFQGILPLDKKKIFFVLKKKLHKQKPFRLPLFCGYKPQVPKN